MTDTPITPAQTDAHQPVTILYTNWRGETAVRQIVPSASADAIGFRSSEWHRTPQWCLLALDAEKVAYRDFALSGIKAWGDEAVAAALAAKPVAQTDALAKLAEIPAVGSEERRAWLEKAEEHGLVSPDEHFWGWAASEYTLLTLMSEARKQGQRDILGASASPSGHSRAEPSGLGASPECPSRDPAAPGVLWSAWSQADADSDPSDPGVAYCTEWFVGRWPVGAEEPDCRILIGTSRTAEIIARRLAERLTSILNTDRLRTAQPEDAR